MSVWQEWRYKSLRAVVIGGARRWWRSLDKPLPWSEELETAVRSADAIPVCHHCTTPCEQPVWFCPVCGASIGPYNNIMPFVRIFARGEALRSGVGPEAHFTRFRAVAYLAIGFVEYGFLSPFYFLRLYLNHRRLSREASAGED